jgi:hypothetical protein
MGFTFNLTLEKTGSQSGARNAALLAGNADSWKLDYDKAEAMTRDRPRLARRYG